MLIFAESGQRKKNGGKGSCSGVVGNAEDLLNIMEEQEIGDTLKSERNPREKPRRRKVNKEYIEECKSFKWLQENWKPKAGDNYFDTIHKKASFWEWSEMKTSEWEEAKFMGVLIFLPLLTQIIEIMGRKFLTLRWQRGASTKEWICEIMRGDGGILTFDASTPELACLRALKEIKKGVEDDNKRSRK